MADTTAQTTETTAERKPPTIADIVREKTGDGRLIIDFFTDVMTGRIEGAELCHRIDAAKQLVKYGSKDAAEFLAKYKGVPCGHSINGRPNPADPCTAEERSLVAVTLNAPATLTRDFLTVLSGIDEFLMARLIRAQTADGVTVIEFLDDVMQDRTDGFKTHHRIAAAKELIVHIVRDEQGSHTPSPSTTPSPLTGEGWGEGDSIVVPAKAGIQRDGGGRNTAANPTRTEPALSTAEGSAHPEPSSPVVPAKAGTQGGGGGRSTAANSARAEPVLSTVEGPSSTVIPAKSLPRTRYGVGIQRDGGGRNTAANPTRTEPALSTAEGPSSTVIPAKSLPRTRYGAGIQRGGGGRNTAANPTRTEPALSTAEGSAHPEPNSSVVPAPTTVVPAEAGTHPPDPVLSTAEGPVHPDLGSPEPVEGSVRAKEPAEGPTLPSLPQLTTNNQQLKTLPAGRSPPS